MKRALSLAARGRRLTIEVRRSRARRRSPRRVRNPASKATEGLSEEVRALYDTLSITGNARDEEMAWQLQTDFLQALREEDWDDLAEDAYAKGDMSAAIEGAKARDPGWLKRWAAGAEAMALRELGPLAPSFLYFDSPAVVRDAWLVHFTDHPRSVASEGFTRGMDDPSQLGLTTLFTDTAKSRPGYVFAYQPEAVARYGFSRGSPKYGHSAVVFQADAVVAWHYADEEPQAISWGPEARHITAVRLDGRLPVIDVDGDEMYFDGFPQLVAFLAAQAKAKRPARKAAKRRVSGAVR